VEQQQERSSAEHDVASKCRGDCLRDSRFCNPVVFTKMLHELGLQLQLLASIPIHLMLTFRYAPILIFVAFITVYRTVYRQGLNDLYISREFESDKYGVVFMYAILSVHAEIISIWYIANAACEDPKGINRGTVLPRAKLCAHRCMFAVLRNFTVAGIFCFNTSPTDIVMQNTHRNGVVILWIIVVFQLFSVQIGTMSSTKVIICVIGYVGLNWAWHSLSDPYSSAPRDTVPTRIAFLSCLSEAALLAWTIPRPYGAA
jgi:hypothetical protein